MLIFRLSELTYSKSVYLLRRARKVRLARKKIWWQAELMKMILPAMLLIVFLPGAIHAQGLIGAPDENQRPLVNRLELERARLFCKGLTDEKSRALYGSIVWQLADKYESLNQWQNALAAYNTLKDLGLPHNAVALCSDCQMRADDHVLAMDEKRLESKVASIESVDNKLFDHNKRMAVPTWGAKEQRAYEISVKNVMLPTGTMVPLKQLLKPR